MMNFLGLPYASMYKTVKEKDCDLLCVNLDSPSSTEDWRKQNGAELNFQTLILSSLVLFIP